LANHQGQQVFLKAALEGFTDTAPDVYTFAVDGYNGRFLLHDSTVALIPPQPVHISVIRGHGFELAAETGVRYLFEAVETTQPNEHNFKTIAVHPSAWHLTSVISANNADTIKLHYTRWNYTESPRCAQTNAQYFTAQFGSSSSDCQAAPGYASAPPTTLTLSVPLFTPNDWTP